MNTEQRKQIEQSIKTHTWTYNAKTGKGMSASMAAELLLGALKKCEDECDNLYYAIQEKNND